MTTLKITTNNVPRLLLYGYELPANQYTEFDYLTPEEYEQASFIAYKGNYYHTGDLMRIDSREFFAGPFYEWDAYEGNTYFSGVLFKFSECGEYVTCASYTS
mgnify:FL=1